MGKNRYTNSRVYSNPYHQPTSFSTGRHLFHSTLNKICFHQSSRIFFFFFPAPNFTGDIVLRVINIKLNIHRTRAAVVDPLVKKKKERDTEINWKKKKRKREREREEKRPYTVVNQSSASFAKRNRRLSAARRSQTFPTCDRTIGLELPETKKSRT